MTTVEERLRALIADQLGCVDEEITPEASFVKDLGADSLDTIELVMAVEDEFGIEIPDEDAEQLRTVHDAITYVEANVRPRAAAPPGEPL